MTGFIQIDGKRFAFESAQLELYHCDSGTADWNLKLVRTVDPPAPPLWLSGTVTPSPRQPDDLHGQQLELECRDLDSVFETLLGSIITTYPGGEIVNRASFTASATEAGLRLVSAFDFDWDRSLDPPDAHHPEVRTARLEFLATIKALHPGGLPG